MLDKEQTNVEKHEISPLELFFDLVFVFAVAQLSSHLLSNLSCRGMAETVILLIAVYNVWLYASFEATLIHIKKPITQWMMLIVMLLGLFMNASINHAFGQIALAFVIPFLITQIGQGILTIRTIEGFFKKHYMIMFGWILLTSPLWIIGSLVDIKSRLIWWGIAALIDIIGTWFAHPAPWRILNSDNIEFDVEHMVERCRLFTIIALGEAVFKAATAISTSPINYMTLIVGSSSLVSIVSLWALYFWSSDHLVAKHIEETTNPILAVRLAINALIIVVLGIILLAVGIEFAIATPYAQTTILMQILLFGGPLLYLVSQGWYLWRINKKFPSYRVGGGIVLIIASLLTYNRAIYISLITSTILLVILSYLIAKITKQSDENNL